MTEKKVSIIVPVYNVELFLDRCICSLQNQTYKNLEIILIDDGSTDKSGLLCDIYSQIDDRIKVIHKCNGGLSDARNVGIKEATGDYLSFVDSDDYIAPNFIDNLLDKCIKYDCKISKCGILSVSDENKEYLFSDSQNQKTHLYTAEMYLQEINRINGGFSVCNKLFAKDLFKDITFPIGKLHEDVAVIYKLIDLSGNIADLQADLYFYYFNPVSITKSKITSRRLDDLDFRLELFQFCMKKGWYQAAINNADVVYRMILEYQQKESIEFHNYDEFMIALKKIKKRLYWKMFFKIPISLKEKIYYGYKLLIK